MLPVNLAKHTNNPALPSSIKQKHPKRRGSLRQTFSNLRVLLDQYVSSFKGHLLTTKGKEKDHKRYAGGTIYVDHATGFTYICNHVSLNAAETIRGKHSFE